MKVKLDTARVFERIFEIYKDQFTLLIPAALILFLPVAIISGIFYSSDAGFVGGLVVTIVSLVATFWFQGTVVEAARDILDGRRDHNLGSLFRSVVPVLGTLVVAGVLVALITLVGFVLLFVPGFVALTFLAVVAPVIVVERLGVIDAMRRSIELVRGTAWQVFSVIVVLFLLDFIANLVLRAVANSADSFALYALAALIVSLLVAPLRALAAAVMFFELKAMRGEPVLATGGEPAAAPVPPTTSIEGGGSDRPA